MRSRSFTVTSFEPAPPTFKGSRYSIIGLETCPTTGRKHHQCYVYWKDAKTFQWMKKRYPTAHIEKANGSPAQNRDYCSKEKNFTETGTIPAQGTRNDIKEFLNCAKKGVSLAEVADLHPSAYCRYNRAYKSIIFEYTKMYSEHNPVDVIVLVGTAGSGKTRLAYDTCPDLYSVEDHTWWDGYVRQDTILIDDFYGSRIPYSKLLRLLDRYRFQLPVKGGYTWKSWDTCIITSNVHPREWYSRGLTPALDRRISLILEF